MFIDFFFLEREGYWLGACLTHAPDQGWNLQHFNVHDHAPTNWADWPGVFIFIMSKPVQTVRSGVYQ